MKAVMDYDDGYERFATGKRSGRELEVWQQESITWEAWQTSATKVEADRNPRDGNMLWV